MKIKLFSALRDAAGKEEVSVPWKQGMTYFDVFEELKRQFRSMTAMLECSFVAVNGRYAQRNQALMPEDEVAVLPPMSGG